MTKILYLPLDERPCNWIFPRELFDNQEIEILRLPDQFRGYKKNGADVFRVLEFVRDNYLGVDGLVISLDMLIYGGLIPSRLHYLETLELIKRLSILEEMKKQFPNLIIYGYSTIMRCPSYNSNDEEHEYYGRYGRNIYDYGVYKHKTKLEIIIKAEKEAFENLNIPQEYLNDFVNRRQINCEVNLKIIDYVQKDIIDFLVIPQDDSGPYGFTAMDQDIIRY